MGGELRPAAASWEPGCVCGSGALDFVDPQPWSAAAFLMQHPLRDAFGSQAEGGDRR